MTDAEIQGLSLVIKQEVERRFDEFENKYRMNSVLMFKNLMQAESLNLKFEFNKLVCEAIERRELVKSQAAPVVRMRGPSKKVGVVKLKGGAA